MPIGKPIRINVSNDELIHLHWDKQLTLRQVGESLGYMASSAQTIMSVLFKKRGLPHRTKAEAVKLRIKLHPETHRGFQRGDKHPQWRGGRHKRPDGYIIIRHSKSRFANRNGVAFEHRLVMSEKLGRPLKRNEIVHHLNGIKDDNRPENLVLTKRTKHNPNSLIQQLQSRIRKLEQLHLL